MNRSLPLLCASLLLMVGCARFSTQQEDIRFGDNGRPGTSVTTTVKAWTLFSARSSLSNFKATQTEKTQGATVGALDQQGGTNVVEALKAIDSILMKIHP